MTGINGTKRTILGEEIVQVGPPQVQVSGRCCALSCIGFNILVAISKCLVIFVLGIYPIAESCIHFSFLVREEAVNFCASLAIYRHPKENLSFVARIDKAFLIGGLKSIVEFRELLYPE